MKSRRWGARFRKRRICCGERERELKDSEQRYRDLFDHAPMPFEETDRDGVIRRFNQAVCALLKCHAGPDSGPPAWDFVAPGPAG